MAKFCLLLCLIALLHASSSIDLECSFNTNFHYSILGKVYRCDIQNNFQVASSEDVVVGSVKGQHWESADNKNVTGLFAYSKDLKFVPKNVENFFENIELIDIVDCGIKEIHQSDLKSFPKLVYCGFKDNQIQTLENGLFDYNLELELVSFWNNKITQVGLNVFDKLNKLSWLYFDDNSCLNIRVEDNRAGVKNMIAVISQNCNTGSNPIPDESKNEIQVLKSQFKGLKDAHDNGFVDMTKRIELLEQKNQKLEKDLSEALEKIKNLESKVDKHEEEAKNVAQQMKSAAELMKMQQLKNAEELMKKQTLAPKVIASNMPYPNKFEDHFQINENRLTGSD